MSNVILDFDAEAVQPEQGFDPLPPGKYCAEIISCTEQATKNQSGFMTVFGFRILEGEYKNRILYDRLNLKNQNQKTVEIARGQLSALCRAVGVLKPYAASELFNKPIVLQVAQQKDNPQYNEIKKYLPANVAAESAPKELFANGMSPWAR